MEEYIKHLEALINPTNIDGDAEPGMFEYNLRKYLGENGDEFEPAKGEITIGRNSAEKAIPELQEAIRKNITIDSTEQDIREALIKQLETVKSLSLPADISLDRFLSERADSYKEYSLNPSAENKLEQVIGMLQQATNSFKGDTELTDEVTKDELEAITKALDSMSIEHKETEGYIGISIEGSYFNLPIQRQKLGRN